MDLSEIYVPTEPTTLYYWVTNDSHFIWVANFLNEMDNLETNGSKQIIRIDHQRR